jgi:hypothetical protein
MKNFFLLLFLIPVLWLQAYQRGPRPPFVSGDGFRSLCDFVFDEEHRTLNPFAIRPYSAIFVKGDYIDYFFKNLHPHIPCPYILVTHNSDDSAPGAFRSVLDEEKLIAWFGQNVDIPFHPKLHPIPIGIANPCWPHGQTSAIEKMQGVPLPKMHLLYINFSQSTYPKERSLVLSLLRDQPFTYISKHKTFASYLEEVASSQFVAAPRGNGLDTHRLWEALYLKAFPIVKTSTLDSLYRDLPVVIVQNWEDVTEEFLLKKLEEFKNRDFSEGKLSLSYWAKLIDSFKQRT